MTRRSAVVAGLVLPAVAALAHLPGHTAVAFVASPATLGRQNSFRSFSPYAHPSVWVGLSRASRPQRVPARRDGGTERLKARAPGSPEGFTGRGRAGGVMAMSTGEDAFAEESVGGDRDGVSDIAAQEASGKTDSGYTRWPASNRIAIGVMASAGALESAFLTYQKMRPGGLNLLCGTSGGCADVLTGPYSNVLGVPLTLPGTVGYLTVAVLALAPLLFQNEDFDKSTRSLILMTTTALGVFAVYLSSLLIFKIGHPCPWCITSACLSLSMCAVAWMRKAVPEKTKAAIMGVCTTLITGLACFSIFVLTETAISIRQAEASPGELVGLELVAAPTADTVSTPQAMRVAKKLKSVGAKMYGAYWCTHCFHQKEMLGEQGMKKVQYVECSNRGLNNQAEMCKDADLPGFPTWDIGGMLYPGEQTLEELETILGLEPFTS